MVQLKIIFGILTIIAVMVSGCVNSNEPTQKPQPIISPTPIPTKEVKIIKFDAQQLILDENDIKEVLEQQGLYQSILKEQQSSNFTSIGGSRFKNPKSTFYVAYKTEGEFAYFVTIELHVYNSINEADQDYLAWSDNDKMFNSLQDTNIGDFGWINVRDNQNVDIVFVKRNILSNIAMVGGLASSGAEPRNVNIETVYKLAKKQDEKISRILEMIQ